MSETDAKIVNIKNIAYLKANKIELCIKIENKSCFFEKKRG